MAAGHPNPRKGIKRTDQERRNIRLGQLKSPKYQALLERSRIRKERLRQAREQRRKQREAKRLLKRATAAYIAAWKLDHAAELKAETSRKMSQARKGCVPWNKGVEAWNKGHYWPEEVKENISKGMIAYWHQRKQQEQQKVQISS
jgi:hypothetical protein